MNYLYHKIPKEMHGNTLYPLNYFKNIFPAVYEKEIAKYQGREFLLKIKLPILNCLWNDVIHLSAVHPSEIKKALIKGGYTEGITMSYFQIEVENLDLERAIIYRYIQNDITDLGREDNFRTFGLNDMKYLSELPKKTKDYYKEMFNKGAKPLLYHHIPHVLYCGSIDILKAKVINV